MRREQTDQEIEDYNPVDENGSTEIGKGCREVRGGLVGLAGFRAAS